MNSATALKSLRSVAPAFTGQSRQYARATLIGRLVAAPVERQTAAGTTYFTYPIAVDRAAKKDADGNVQRDDNGYPVRDSDYHTVFNFKEGAAERLPNLVIGSQILVEANIGTRTSEVEGRKTYSTTLTELSHRVLSRPKNAQDDQASA